MWDLISLGILLGGCPLQPVQSPVVREPRAIRDYVGNSQGRQDAMKPRIRLASYTKGYWVCLTTRTSWWRGGVGRTPVEAYKDWERQNVNQNS